MRAFLASKKTWLHSMVIMGLVASCNIPSSSDLRIVNGKEINEDTYPYVVQISAVISGGLNAACSATWVSDSTIITAAHCLFEGKRKLTNVTVSRGAGKGAKATAVLTHPQYSDFGADVAVLVFPPNSSPEHVGVAAKAPTTGDPMVLVGYGKFDHLDGKSGGKKRFGWNKVIGLDSQGRINFEGFRRPETNEGTGKEVTNSQGDSGGPLFVHDALIGVSSTVNSQATATGKSRGNYENLRHPPNEEFLQAAVKQGAKIRGLNDDDRKPTTPSPNILVNGINNNGTGGEKQDIAVGFVPTNSSTSATLMMSCIKCKKIEATVKTASGTALTLKGVYIGNKDEREFFQLMELEKPDMAIVTVNALDDGNNLIATRKFSLKQK